MTGAAGPSFYTPLGEDDGWTHVQPTEHTVSVWADTLQHGGPPSALLVWAIERAGVPAGTAISRITIDILGAVGLEENRVRARIVRPGRRISLVEADLDVRVARGGFRTAARASAWVLATGDTAGIAAPSSTAVDAPVGTGDDRPAEWVDQGWGHTGFIAAVDVVGVHDPGPTWLRPRYPLVAGEDAGPYARFCCVVDIANGLGSRLSARQWQWMNTDTTIHLVRRPVGDWVGVDAQLVAGPDGYGYTGADLYDGSGRVGRSSQTVLIAPQP
ncbi:thioesterase family protein [Williamsia serinedens]|uniref:Thioesterase-like superfamily protein n=1 Tax=Williamsia serinedens TaxID=391736 RepID=A0ABT1GXL3_9NOCA|nr:thioesterase family protein [Williamsia serinedens]MCP2159297.1 Thioesterase-like superfamily protein [Williamsia serinedens]